MSMKNVTVIVLAGLSLGIFAIPALAADWPSWRGPNHDGSTVAENLPTSFSTTENVVWAVDMPGVSSATPAIADGRVYLVSNDESRTKLSGMCIEAETGKVLWSREFVTGTNPTSRNDMASCSPVTDGENVYFLFGSSDLFALDKDGNDRWSMNLTVNFGAIAQGHGYSSTPLLVNGRLYIQVLRGEWETDLGMKNHTDADSKVICLDAATGGVVWNIHRPTDAVGESFDSYTSPVLYTRDGKTVLTIMGGDYITGHDLDTGEEQWRHFHNPRQGMMDRLIPSPVVAGELVVGLQPRGVDAFAFNPAAGKTLTYEESAWVFDEKTSDVATPLVYDGNLFIINGERKQLICLNPKTGKPHYYEDLDADSRIWSSPTAADGKIYALTEKGQVIIAAASEEFEVINRINLGSAAPSKASIAIANNRLFIRTAERLYCVGE